MGIISGAIIEFTTPTPVHFYIFPSVVAYGITYDAFMSKRPLRLYPKTSAVLIATALSSAAMAGVALSVLTYSGFFLPEILPMIWFFGVLRDVLLGLVGALIGIKISRTILHIR
ncbi:MAG: hypothetical protein JSV51_04525 [Candidatus Bathyarchaeota archaeon]|nr:MAG: hypothetical protein JSV51_04525 [Candidatus Bathyarchaeota archaeon]